MKALKGLVNLGQVLHDSTQVKRWGPIPTFRSGTWGRSHLMSFVVPGSGVRGSSELGFTGLGTSSTSSTGLLGSRG